MVICLVSGKIFSDAVGLLIGFYCLLRPSKLYNIWFSDVIFVSSDSIADIVSLGRWQSVSSIITYFQSLRAVLLQSSLPNAVKELYSLLTPSLYLRVLSFSITFAFNSCLSILLSCVIVCDLFLGLIYIFVYFLFVLPLLGDTRSSAFVFIYFLCEFHF